MLLHVRCRACVLIVRHISLSFVRRYFLRCTKCKQHEHDVKLTLQIINGLTCCSDCSFRLNQRWCFRGCHITQSEFILSFPMFSRGNRQQAISLLAIQILKERYGSVTTSWCGAILLRWSGCVPVLLPLLQRASDRGAPDGGAHCDSWRQVRRLNQNRLATWI